MPIALAVRGAPIDAETMADRKNHPVSTGWATRADIGSDMRIAPSLEWSQSNLIHNPGISAETDNIITQLAADQVRKSRDDYNPHQGLLAALGLGGNSKGDGNVISAFGNEGGVKDMRGKRHGVPEGEVTKAGVFNGYFKDSEETKDFFDTEVGSWVKENKSWLYPILKVGGAFVTGGQSAIGPTALREIYKFVQSRNDPSNQNYNPKIADKIGPGIDKVFNSNIGRNAPKIYSSLSNAFNGYEAYRDYQAAMDAIRRLSAGGNQ